LNLILCKYYHFLVTAKQYQSPFIPPLPFNAWHWASLHYYWAIALSLSHYIITELLYYRWAITLLLSNYTVAKPSNHYPQLNWPLSSQNFKKPQLYDNILHDVRFCIKNCFPIKLYDIKKKSILVPTWFILVSLHII
jgi:hypothetical protein